MKKNTRRSIFFPVLLSILATVTVFAVAEYIFHIPSSLLRGGASLQGVTTQDKKWNHTVAGDTQGQDEVPVEGVNKNGELVLWPSIGDVSGSSEKSPVVTTATGKDEQPAKDVQKIDESVSCTLEYLPVCGADGRTYSNACMANRAKTIVAHEGGCTSETTTTPTYKITEEINATDSEISFDTGSYVLYQNASYSFYLPKYAYYSGYGPQDGAAHTLAIGLTATSIDTFDSSDIRVLFYRAEPAEAPAGKKIATTNGILYVEGDMSNAKIAKIIDTIGASAK